MWSSTSTGQPIEFRANIAGTTVEESFTSPCISAIVSESMITRSKPPRATSAPSDPTVSTSAPCGSMTVTSNCSSPAARA